MKKIIYISLFLSLGLNVVSCKPKYYIRMADSEMTRNPQSWMLDFSDKPKWSYCQGLELQAILQVYNKTGEKKYFDYAESFADTMINNNGSIKTYELEKYNLDMLNSGKILFPIYDITQKTKYKKAIDLLKSQTDNQPRVSNGGFWHKKIYPHQVWLDGIYMAMPFLAQYGKEFNQPELFDDITSQIINAEKDLKDEKTGLLYHGWEESRQQRWSDPITGRSPNFWSRSIGWYMMALVDVLDFLPENHPKRTDIIRILNDLSKSLEKYQDKKTGMWYQVTDKGGKEGNYLESSGSIMFIYAWVKGAQKGYLPEEFLKKGEKAYQQYVEQFIKENPDGTISLTNVCSVAGLGGNPYRDGSYEYYISEPKRDNDAKAVAPFIMVSIMLNK
ncbi:Unsaturated rhamnogalacturonyl hydrolase YteR [uncultured Paludibacter sp.]|uniref:Unsaturated rhamnogalacturonyl hydrolase YteR n=1 Tax=uncultured Paludibacter sp. TaxID=497635 RepID=A0A653AK43_9BACT|nr:Unsaturated rhamnogalacturonyl hydrolase YteR [uncultured Paludibacter sp.]